MATFSNWIQAFRLRTLPLSASVILAGASLIYIPVVFEWQVFVLCLTTTFSLQILSNLANDYGDFSSGTDNAERIGPKRTMQQGFITVSQMKMALLIFILLSLVSGIGLLLTAFNLDELKKVGLFFGLGIVCIAAAIKYTVGKSAYGYRGLGDIAVFLFFGIVGVLGSAYLYVHLFRSEFILVAVCFGLLSAAVLNVNNMRDHVNDKQHNKNTLVVKIGLPTARVYHVVIVFIALCCLTGYAILTAHSWKEYFFLAIFPLLIYDAIRLLRIESEKMDPFLKRTAIFTFLLSVLFFIGKIISFY
ncbi:MAG: 1,4-dihydroxy-2-naphthoate octaprenyltransferase [Flavobacteriales bacterium]